MRVSVAMCTFRGARFVAEQLFSFAEQTRVPDEVVVCDDASEDDTVAVVERFARTSPFPVRLEVNATRVGWIRNFERATELCHGDVIFYSDQDDVWDRTKIEKLLRCFEEDERVGFAFCDAELVDEALAPLGRGLWQAIRLSARDRERIVAGGAIDHLVTHFKILTPGMSLAFRAPYRDLILPFPEGWAHDTWVPAVLAAVGAEVGIVPERLLRWRQHGSQLTGMPIINALHRHNRVRVGVRGHSRAVEKCGAFLERLRATSHRYPPDPRAIAALEGRMRHALARSEIGKTRGRVATILGELLSGNYHRYSRGLWSAMKDLVQGAEPPPTTTRTRGPFTA